MATPPFPPPQDARRQQKEYWRAQKDVLRNQRRDQRYYWRAMHRPSIVGPLFLLGVGIVALLIESGKLNSGVFWEWFLRWWPLLLIAVGLASLLEWFLDRDQPYRRQGGTFGIVLVISILAGIAYSHNHIRHLAEQFGGDDGDWSGFMGQEHDHDVDHTVSVPASAAVQVQNPRGDVTITGSGDGQLHVHAHQLVHSNSDHEADRTFPALEPKVSVNGSSVLVSVEGRNNGRADLTIEIPESASVDVNAGRGDVSVDGLKGAANINSGRGDVKLASIGGSAHVHMSKGDFSAHQMGAGVTLDGHLGDVTVSEVVGSLSLDGEFFGDTHLEQIGSVVHFHSSRTDLLVSRLAGDMTMDSDDLHVGQAVGPLRITTRSKNIECSQVSGDVRIVNANGEVSVTAVEPLGNIEITNASDPVTLTLPPGAGFSIDAKTDGGDLNTDFSLNTGGSEGHQSASGTVGAGGPKIEVTVRHGDISLKKGSTSMPSLPAPPAMPKMPMKPAPPAGPMKHLRPPADVKAEPNVL